MPDRAAESNSSDVTAALPILVVDDDPQVCGTIRWALEEEGWLVDTAADGHQALEKATHRQPRLVILDMGLPLLRGDKLAAELRAVYGDSVPILLITADGHIVEKARLVSARAYLPKPFELDDLCKTVQQVLNAS